MKFGEIEVHVSPFLPEGTWAVVGDKEMAVAKNGEVRVFKYPAGFVPPSPQPEREEPTTLNKELRKADRERNEVFLLEEMRKAGLPEPVREFRFALPERQWRADFAYLDERVLIEVEGGESVVGGGRHRQREGYAVDCEKHNEANIRGYLLLRFTLDMIADGSAVAVIRLALTKARAR